MRMTKAEWVVSVVGGAAFAAWLRMAAHGWLLVIEPLTTEELARMRRDHVRHPQWGICLRCADNDCRRDPRGEWPCDAAKLLADRDDRDYGTNVYGRDPMEFMTVDAFSDHCHCGAEGMGPSHPRHGTDPGQLVPDLWTADAIVAREADLALDKAFEAAGEA